MLFQYTMSERTESRIRTDGRTYVRNIPLSVTVATLNIRGITVFVIANNVAHPWSNPFRVERCNERSNVASNITYSNFRVHVQFCCSSTMLPKYQTAHNSDFICGNHMTQ